MHKYTQCVDSSAIAAFVLVVYLNKRAQVVFQSFLVTSRNYMYNHTKGTEKGIHI